MMRTKSRISKLLLFLLAFIAVFPIVMTIFHSFMGVDELTYSYPKLFKEGDIEPILGFHMIPYKMTLSGYYKLIFEKIEFIKVYINTIFIVFSIILGQSLISITASYCLVHNKLKYKKQIIGLLIFTALMPFQVTAVPNYIMLNRFGILNTWYSLLVIGIFSAFGTLLLMPFMKRVSASSIEAARIDGASEIQLLLKVVIPQIKSGIGLLMIFLFIDYWNMVEQPMVFIQDMWKHPMSVFLNYIAQTDMASFFPGASLYIIPSLLVFMGLIYLVSSEIEQIGETEKSN